MNEQASETEIVDTIGQEIEDVASTNAILREQLEIANSNAGSLQGTFSKLKKKSGYHQV